MANTPTDTKHQIDPLHRRRVVENLTGLSRSSIYAKIAEGSRVCFDGRYESERKSPQARRLQKAFKIRERLGQTDGNLHLPFPERPRHMHHRKYERIRAQAKALEHEIGIHNLAYIRKCSVESIRKKLAEGKLREVRVMD